MRGFPSLAAAALLACFSLLQIPAAVSVNRFTVGDSWGWNPNFMHTEYFKSGMEEASERALAEEMTPLQKHAAFFDRNKDGVIYVSETYEGMRALGFGITVSSTVAVLINGLLGPLTRLGNRSSLIPAVYVSNIQKGKHGSDTGAYDSEGRFVPEKFEAIFEKHAKTNPNALTSSELMDMLKANRIPEDDVGWTSAQLEWKLLYSLCKDKDGLLSKENMRAVYDGSIFYRLEKKTSEKRRGAWRRGLVMEA